VIMSKNWHWKQRELGGWAKTWMEQSLTGLSTGTTTIDNVKEIVEDCCTLGMRKSKLITVYDLKVIAAWSGKLDSEDTTIKGLITAIEVSHDMDIDDYVFEVIFEDPSAYNNNSQAQKLRQDVQKNLAKLMAEKFQMLPKAMIDTHGKDMLDAQAASQNGGESPAASGTSTPVIKAATTATTAASTVSAPAKKEKVAVSSAIVRTEGEFMASAADLFDLLTNASKVPTWSRNPATISLSPNSPISLFSGNITGTMLSSSSPTEFTQTWRAPTWPEGHFAELTVKLEQGSSSTKLVLKMKDVPVGKEDETEKGLEIYYIRSLKQIGLGSIL